MMSLSFIRIELGNKRGWTKNSKICTDLAFCAKPLPTVECGHAFVSGSDGLVVQRSVKFGNERAEQEPQSPC